MAVITHAALATRPEVAVTQWHNPDYDIIGTASPISSFRSEQNERCREFQQTVTFDGVTEVAYGTACRQENGGWKIASSNEYSGPGGRPITVSAARQTFLDRINSIRERSQIGEAR